MTLSVVSGVDEVLTQMLVDVMLENQRYYQFHQVIATERVCLRARPLMRPSALPPRAQHLQYHILSDSIPLAERLVRARVSAEGNAL